MLYVCFLLQTSDWISTYILFVLGITYNVVLTTPESTFLILSNTCPLRPHPRLRAQCRCQLQLEIRVIYLFRTHIHCIISIECFLQKKS